MLGYIVKLFSTMHEIKNIKFIFSVVLKHPVETLASRFVQSMICGMKWENVHVGWLPSEQELFLDFPNLNPYF